MTVGKCNVIQIWCILVYGVFIPQRIGSLDLSAKGSISLSALFYLMLLLIF